MDHDEEECPGLHSKIEYTVRGYSLSKGAIEFEAWFNTVFKTQSRAFESFEFSRNEDSGEQLIEVVQYHPQFNIDALESLFFAYLSEKDSLKPKVLRIIDSKLN